MKFPSQKYTWKWIVWVGILISQNTDYWHNKTSPRNISVFQFVSLPGKQHILSFSSFPWLYRQWHFTFPTRLFQERNTLAALQGAGGTCSGIHRLLISNPICLRYKGSLGSIQSLGILYVYNPISVLVLSGPSIGYGVHLPPATQGGNLICI